MQLRDHSRPLADRRADALDRPVPYSTDGEYATDARFKRHRGARPIVRTRIRGDKIGTGLHKPLCRSRVTPQERNQSVAAKAPMNKNRFRILRSVSPPPRRFFHRTCSSRLSYRNSAAMPQLCQRAADGFRRNGEVVGDFVARHRERDLFLAVARQALDHVEQEGDDLFCRGHLTEN
jgi:hypothetical protein